MKRLDIYNEQQLRQVLDRFGQQVMWAVEGSVKQHLKEETEKTVYATEPVLYERSYDFLNSISSNTLYRNGKYACNIFFDTNKMSSSKGVFAKNVNGKMVNVVYGKHTNNKGEDVRDRLVMYLEEGVRGSRPYAYTVSGKKAGLHMYKPRPGSHMVKNTRRWLSESMVPIVLDAASGIWDNQIFVSR